MMAVFAMILGIVYTGRGLYLLGISATRPFDLAL